MGKPSKAVLAFMEQYKIDNDEIWEVHGSQWVVKHKALERVAVEVGVKWDRPSVITCDMAGKIAVICAFGKLGDKEEWSFGEAAPANNKNSYPMAMAEKRAKDRVILKLLTTHGALYSESEADDFVEPRRNPHVTRAADIVPATEYDEHGNPIDNIPHPDPEAIKKLTVKDQRPVFEALQKEIHATTTVAQLQTWAVTNKNRLGELKPDWQEFLRGVYAEQIAALRTQERGDDMRLAG
jgi:hypothetical protein